MDMGHRILAINIILAYCAKVAIFLKSDVGFPPIGDYRATDSTCSFTNPARFSAVAEFHNPYPASTKGLAFYFDL
jgi:hypothetical protein